MGMNGAFAIKSPSGPNSAHEKSSRSLILVLMDVCWRLRPIASATLMNRFAKSVNKMGSGLFGSPMVAVVREGAVIAEAITSVFTVTGSHDHSTSLALIPLSENTDSNYEWGILVLSG